MRLTLFLSVYIDDLFKNDHIEFMSCCEYLFMNLLSNDEGKALSFHAADALSDLIAIKKNTMSEMVQVFYLKFNTRIKEQILVNTNSIFFDVILEIVGNINLDENVLDITTFLIDRIIIEENNSKNNKDKKLTNKKCVVVLKCLNIIKTIVSNNQCISSYTVIYYFILY